MDAVPSLLVLVRGFGVGFKNAKELGRKMVSLFTLSGQLLSSQQHYDWGLRALKSVMRGAGSLLTQKRHNCQVRCSWGQRSS